ncbi:MULTISPECIES: MlaD family protein [Protofrankia]|uniref:Mammalian cell entry protein n=1 Tax=Protofrankia coriariae TaxID=1562887 RepID=A0ABR5F3G6_9ACTN|nr:MULTISPECIES: MlaD family protein [Protofrankia]KLL11258.1 mammalian cell entry protein [Protofrankia coriariae]ONH35878.1 mammalian cell entry protein [Protofrankia sp. BMG5.30]
MRRIGLVALAAVVVLVASGWTLFGNDYRVGVLLGSATNIVKGGSVMVNGFEAGSVSGIRVKDGKAYLELTLDSDHAPLHSGATVSVAWKALLGERLVEVHDGPTSNPRIPSGGMLEGTMDQPTELDQVLNALDPTTRTHLSSLVRELDGTLQGNEQDVRATLQSAGPALSAVGQVLKGIGTDGPAIKNLVVTLNQLTSTLAARDGNLRGIINDLTHLTSVVAGQRQQLSTSLQKLPGTLDQANSTLAVVPGVADKAVPLLNDLRPAAEKLPSVSRNLRPLLADLRPVIADLRPTLVAADELLDITPGLLDQAHAAVPGTTAALDYLQPAFAFLRPYTPEAVSFLGQWGSAFANYDANGHYARGHIQAGATSVNHNPGVLVPGLRNDPYPLPGAIGNQPWTDAFGSSAR